MKLFTSITLCATLLLAQDPVFRGQTEVVNIDVLVRQAQSRQPIDGLTANQFSIKVDGKSTPIAYFRKDGDSRRPLLLMFCFSLAAEGGLRELLTPAASRSFTTALSQLKPDDEVAVYSVEDWFVSEPKRLSPPTRDRSTSTAAFTLAVQQAQSRTEADRREDRTSGARSMAGIVQAASSLSAEYPNHQVALVWISDGMNTLDMFESRQRTRLLDSLDTSAISFSSIQLPMLGSYAAAATVLNPVGKLFGMQFTGSGKQFAKDTGGIAMDIPAASELASALSQIVAAHTARYSLGINVPSTINPEKWHKIEVKVDSTHRLEVSARRRFSTRPNLNSPEFSLRSKN